MYILLNFTNPGREKELISSNVHMLILAFIAKNCPSDNL